MRFFLRPSLISILLCHHTDALTSRSTRAQFTMVEGHSVHRIASRFRTKLVGKSFAASSPNGRFTDGSAAIDGCVLSGMEAVGKNLFAIFASPASSTASETVVHVHFGMSGAWSVFHKSDEPEVKPTTRLRLEEISSDNNPLVAHLSAMTVQHGDSSLYTAKKAALGEDPLRPDADPNVLYEKVKKSKKSIGALIMDQSYFAGPGNIYRAEILFLAGIYPTTPGASLDRASFDKIWDASVKLLRRGYDTGSILTVDAETDPILAARRERRYIYNKSHCARCSGPVGSWDMSGRTCYACEGTCQPKNTITAASPPTKAANKTAAKKVAVKSEQHVPFISHCARDTHKKRLDQHGPKGLTIAEIRSILEDVVGTDALPPKSAKKAVYVDALTATLSKNASKKTESAGALPPPTISAEDAAREKASAGENRAVEHVAELSRDQAIDAIGIVTPSPSGAKKVKAEKRKAASGNSHEGPRRKSARRRLSVPAVKENTASLR